MENTGALRHYRDLMALKTSDGRYLALHGRNLEIAEIDEPAWSAMEMAGPNDEARAELQLWERTDSDEANTAESGNKINSLSINIAQICNLKCTYCAAGGDGTYGSTQAKIDLSAAEKQIDHALKSLNTGETLLIRYFGGEPLLYPNEIEKISRYARLKTAGSGIGLQFSINTNGTMISEKVATLLADLNCSVIVSLDGPSELNEQNRPSKNKNQHSTDMTIAGLRELQKVRNQLQRLNFTAVFSTFNTDLLETYRFLSEWNPDTINFIFDLKSESDELNQLYLREMRRVLDFAWISGGSAEIRKISPFAAYLSALESQTRKLNHCGAGRTQIEMDTKGNLFACGWLMTDSKEKVGTAGNLELANIAKYQESQIKLNNCQTCWARFLCGGGCMAINKQKRGDKHLADPDFCNRVQGIIALAVEYFVKIHVSQNQEIS